MRKHERGTRVRIEAARTEQALREADLQRILDTRVAAKEMERVETVERTNRRGGNGSKLVARINDTGPEGR